MLQVKVRYLSLVHIKKWFKHNADRSHDTVAYGIMNACKQCTYAKSYEPILIFSKLRGPRIIVNLDSKTYVRHGECLSFSLCGKCFDQAVSNLDSLPCKWNCI